MATTPWPRIGLMVGGSWHRVPLTLLFGIFGFIFGLFFILLAALAT